jgi:predicted PurR-regulated permease PerM
MDDLGGESTRARRERWWRSSFFVLGTIYIGLLLLGLLLQAVAGFSQIVLVVFLAWLLAFVVSPVVAWLQRRFRMPRGVALGLAYLATLVGSGFVLFYAGSSIGASVGELADDFPLTRARIEGTLHEWENAVSFGRFAPDLVAVYRDLEEAVSRVGTSVVGEVPGVSAAVLGSLGLVIILSMYMVADSAGILAKLNRVVPARWADEFEILERTISRAFGGFLRAQVILTGVQAVLTLAVVVILGLPYGFLIVAASVLAMLIPFFGPPLALIPPILATAIFATDWVIPTLVVLFVVQGVLVNYLQPRLMQDALGMHPLLVLVGLLVGAQVAGLWGALFGIPVLAVLNVFFNYAVNLRTIEEGSPEELEEVLEEVRLEAPEATPEEVAALAADRIEEAHEDAVHDAADQVDSATEDLRAAAGDLRQAAGEQRSAAGEIGESAADLRDAADRLAEGRSD